MGNADAGAVSEAERQALARRLERTLPKDAPGTVVSPDFVGTMRAIRAQRELGGREG